MSHAPYKEKSLNEWKPILAGYWDLDDASERDRIAAAFLALAETQETAEFGRAIRQCFTQDIESGITVVYELLANNPAKWSGFFEEEVRRAFAAAGRSDHPSEMLDCLEEISMVDEHFIPLRDALLPIFTDYVRHANKVIRFKAIWFMGDWLPEASSNRSASAIASLVRALSDTEWQIRVLAFQTLRGINALPKGRRLSLADRWRKRWSEDFHLTSTKVLERDLY